MPAYRVEEVLDLVGLDDRGRGDVSEGSRSACVSDSPWPRHWSVTQRSWSWMSRSTGSTRRGSRPCGRSCDSSPTRGGTVFLSSHLLSEVAHSADDAIVIHRGRLVSAGPVADLTSGSAGVVVTTADADLLAVTLARRGATVERTSPNTLTVTGATREVVGRAAARHRRRGHRHARHRRRPRVRFRRPHPAPGGNLMISLVRIELLKLRTTPGGVRRTGPGVLPHLRLGPHYDPAGRPARAPPRSDRWRTSATCCPSAWSPRSRC